jgi:hypothetical protein
MKAIRTVFLSVVSAALIAGTASGEIVTFNSPGQWTTERTDKIVLKVQLDTSKIPQKKIAVVLSKIEGGKKKQVTTKSFKVTDYSQEFDVGPVGATLLGGKNFFKIEWSIPGTKEKGGLFPVGLVNLDRIPAVTPLHAQKTQTPANDKNAAALAANAGFTAVKGVEFALLWTPKSLSILCKKGTGKDVIKFAFDGKNAKNAFISYPDRVVELFTANDSMATLLYERAALNDSINFPEKEWKCEAEKNTIGDITIINIPWYDIGLIAQDERALGFAAFVTDEKMTVKAAYPDKATLLMPGSWSSIILDK